MFLSHADDQLIFFLSTNVGLSQYFFNIDSIYQMTILVFLKGTEDCDM